MNDKTSCTPAPQPAMATLRIKFENDKGDTVLAPIDVRFPRDMSVRIAQMYFLEAISKRMKAAAAEMLKGIGLN